MHTKKGAPYSRNVRQAVEAGKASGKARKAEVAASALGGMAGAAANTIMTAKRKRDKAIEDAGG